MGTITRRFEEKVDCIVTESYVYAPVDLSSCKDVKRVKVVRSLWDTGASVTLISARVAKVLGLTSIGKSGVSGYNEGIDVKDTYCIHVEVFENFISICNTGRNEYALKLKGTKKCNLQFAVFGAKASSFSIIRAI